LLGFPDECGRLHLAVDGMEVVGKVGEFGVVQRVIPAQNSLVLTNQGIAILAQGSVEIEVHVVAVNQIDAPLGDKIVD